MRTNNLNPTNSDKMYAISNETVISKWRLRTTRSNAYRNNEFMHLKCRLITRIGFCSLPPHIQRSPLCVMNKLCWCVHPVIWRCLNQRVRSTDNSINSTVLATSDNQRTFSISRNKQHNLRTFKKYLELLLNQTIKIVNVRMVQGKKKVGHVLKISENDYVYPYKYFVIFLKKACFLLFF